MIKLIKGLFKSKKVLKFSDFYAALKEIAGDDHFDATIYKSPLGHDGGKNYGENFIFKGYVAGKGLFTDSTIEGVLEQLKNCDNPVIGSSKIEEIIIE